MSPHDPLEGERPHHHAQRPVLPSADRLPSYLGLCWLERSSVRADDGRLSAIYSHADGLSYRIEWGPDGCRLTEFDGERRLSTSFGADLEGVAFQYGLARLNRAPSSLWERIAYRLGDRAYVQTDVEEAESMIIPFPALAMGCVRFVLPDGARALSGPTLQPEPDSAPNPRIGAWGASAGVIVRRWADGSSTVERVQVVDRVAPAIDLEELVEEARSRWPLEPGKEYRLVVGPMDLASSVVSGYTGDERRALVSYAIAKEFVECGLETSTPYARDLLAEWRPETFG